MPRQRLLDSHPTTWLAAATLCGGVPGPNTSTDRNREGPPMATEQTTRWYLQGQGYEFCNCQFGCGCNFGGFPNSTDGSCRAFVGLTVTKGACADVDLSGLKLAGILAWPRAIHEGKGKGVFVVEPATTDRQGGAAAQRFTGKPGGV